MNYENLVTSVKERKNFLCVGLDTDPELIPDHLKDSEDPVFEFNRQIIDATKNHCVAYKVNTAFYEAHGIRGWETLEKTAHYIPDTHFRIADAKRGDIGNTSKNYAKAFFEIMPFDAITVSPYMGYDSILPFLEYENKCTIILALTSNKSSNDFQMLDNMGEPIYARVVRTSMNWAHHSKIMYVVGATHPYQLREIRDMAPNHFFLVPGVGAQGGDLREIVDNGLNSNVGLLVNASRSIIYASNGTDFAIEAQKAAQVLADQMAEIFQ